MIIHGFTNKLFKGNYEDHIEQSYHGCQNIADYGEKPSRAAFMSSSDVVLEVIHDAACILSDVVDHAILPGPGTELAALREETREL